MKKTTPLKQTKRLELRTETIRELRTLDDKDLARIAGGVSTVQHQSSNCTI